MEHYLNHSWGGQSKINPMQSIIFRHLEYQGGRLQAGFGVLSQVQCFLFHESFSTATMESSGVDVEEGNKICTCTLLYPLIITTVENESVV